MPFRVSLQSAVPRLICLLLPWIAAVLLSSAPAPAQQTRPANDDVAVLKQEVRDLKATQQQILDRLDELKKILRPEPPAVKAPATLSLRGESFQGDARAPIAIVEYADFECPFCGRYKHDTYPQLLSNYIEHGTVKYYYRDFPLAFHENALQAARAARCAGEQGKFWRMHDSLFADQKALTTKDIQERSMRLGLDTAKMQECLASDRYSQDIKTIVADAEKMEISGTPTFLIGTISSDGTFAVRKTIVGAYPYDTFKSALDELLSESAPKGN